MCYQVVLAAILKVNARADYQLQDVKELDDAVWKVTANFSVVLSPGIGQLCP